jgi:hypothetical protein
MPIVASSKSSDYSPTWRWADDEPLEGTHVEFRTATVPERGDVAVWELETDVYGPVSVWVEPANLKLKVRRELRNRLRERGNARIEKGERIRINPGTKRPSKRNPNQTVWPFPEVWFEHGAPDQSAEELLLSSEEPSEEQADAESQDREDDDIPF